MHALQFLNFFLSLLWFTSGSLSAPAPSHVESNKLRRVITRFNLLRHAAKLQEFSDASPEHNRAFGGIGHKLTVDYIYDNFMKMNEYYTVEKQEFSYEYSYGVSNFTAEGEFFESSYFTYSPSTNGPLTLELVNTDNLGCNQVRIVLLIFGLVGLRAKVYRLWNEG